MATPEQIDEIRRLCRLLLVPERGVERFAGLAFTELTEDQADKVLSALVNGEFGGQHPTIILRGLAYRRWGEMCGGPLLEFIHRFYPKVQAAEEWMKCCEAAHVVVELDREMHPGTDLEA